MEHSTSKFGSQLEPHQDELLQLAELAGIHMDNRVFRIFVELLNMGVDPNTIFSVVKGIRRNAIRSSRGRATSIDYSPKN